MEDKKKMFDEFDADDIYIEGDWENSLNEAYEKGKKHLDSLPPVVRIEHLTGFAKTARVNAWLRHFKYENFYITSTLRRTTSIEVEVEETPKIKEGIYVVSDEEMKNILIPKKVKKNINAVFSSDEIDRMNEKDMIIVIDDYDWASLDVREELLNIIRFSEVTDLREKENNFKKKLNDIAMIVLITHPYASPFSEPYTELENQLFGRKEY